MSIRIVPESERSPGVDHIAAVLLPAVDAAAYARRAARLRQLADGHVMADYLRWAADLVSAQQAAHEAKPLPGADVQALVQALHDQTQAPLHSGYWHRSAHWHAVLAQLLVQLDLHPSMHSAPLQQAIAVLRHASHDQCDQWADVLLAVLRGDETPQDSALPEAGVAQILWSALSVYWRQLASQLPATGVAQAGEHRHLCPVCNHLPTGSLVMAGAQAGLRYVQCNLCESLWHVVRTKCTNCDGTETLDYWCLESEKAPIKAESCGDCHSYLKAFYLQTDHQLELVADDLASLALDAEMEAQDVARSGFNPLMLP